MPLSAYSMQFHQSYGDSDIVDETKRKREREREMIKQIHNTNTCTIQIQNPKYTSSQQHSTYLLHNSNPNT
jgi:hypothetical protein